MEVESSQSKELELKSDEKKKGQVSVTLKSDESKKGRVSVTVLEAGERSMRMVLDGLDSSFVNAWRRSIMGEVEVMAIDRLQIHQNTTMMHDDLLFHRLGLLPLICTNLDRYSLRTECDCDDGCPRCMAKFTLDVANKSDEPVEVTSENLIPSIGSGVAAVSSKIMLVKLHKNQSLSFTAFAVKSTSRFENNAKWSAVTVASYRPTATVRVNSELMNRFLTPDEQKRVCKAEPAQPFVYNEQTKRTDLHPDASLRATYTGEFIEQLADILHPPDQKDEKRNQMEEIKVDNPKIMRHPTELVHPMASMIPRRDQFLFPIVSTGCMPPKEIALRALNALKKRLLAIQILNRRQKLFSTQKQPS